MPALATASDTQEDAPVTSCPECGEVYWDARITHCDHDGAYLVAVTGGQTRVDRIVGGRYRLLGKLGQGGMGTVYLAEHGTSGRKVALKIIRPELESSAVARQRFLRECQTLERVKSPHVVEVIESGSVADGEIYLVMELLEGQSLGDRLESGALSIDEAARVGAQVAAALATAHAQGIVHRDLKPDNVFLCTSGIVKVLDFGIARLVDGHVLEAGAAKKLTATGSILGTPAYMSPEAAGGQPVGPPADLYSLGVILHEMIDGAPPFTDAQPVLLMSKHLKEPPPPLRTAVPAPLARLVALLLEKEPEERPAEAAAVARSLASIASGSVGDTPVVPARRRRGRARLAIAALAIAGALSVAGVFVSLRLSRAAYEPAPDRAAATLPRDEPAPPPIAPQASAPPPPAAPIEAASEPPPGIDPPAQVEDAPPRRAARRRPRPRRAARPARPGRRPVTEIETRW